MSKRLKEALMLTVFLSLILFLVAVPVVVAQQEQAAKSYLIQCTDGRQALKLTPEQLAFAKTKGLRSSLWSGWSYPGTQAELLALFKTPEVGTVNLTAIGLKLGETLFVSGELTGTVAIVDAATGKSQFATIRLKLEAVKEGQ